MANDTKSTLISGVFYTALAKYSSVLVSLVVSGILARLLPPHDFGVMAIAMVVIAFFSIFSDMGIAPAIVQNKELDNQDYHQIFSFTFWLGLSLAVLFFIFSPLIASFYKSTELINICRLLAINLFFASINIVPNGLLFKEKRFKFLGMRTLVVQLLSGAIGVTAAFMGAGVYALIINPIFSAIALFIINYYQNPLRFHFKFKLASIQKIYNYSVYQFLFNIINYFSRNIDKLLIGKYMGMTPLGYYDKSYRLMMLPLDNITNVVSPVMHPVFSDLQNDLRALAQSYLKVLRVFAFLGFPLSVYLFFNAKELILIIFGDRWMPSVPIFEILALSVGFQVILSSSGAIFQASNSTIGLFISGVLSTILNVLAIVCGIFVFKSLEAVAIGITITFIINFFQCYIILFRFTLKARFLTFLSILVSPLLLTLLLGIVLSGVYFITKDLPLIVSLIIKTTATFIVSGCYIQIAGVYNIKELIHNVLKKYGK